MSQVVAFSRSIYRRCPAVIATARCAGVPKGASFVTWTAVPPEQFRYTSGEKNVSVYQSSENGPRSFCRTCGSQTLCQTEPEAIEIALVALHGPIDREPGEYWYFDSRTEWTRVRVAAPDQLAKRICSLTLGFRSR